MTSNSGDSKEAIKIKIKIKIIIDLGSSPNIYMLSKS